MSKDNLLSLKDDMVAFIEGHGLRRLPGYVTEDIPSVLWEDQNNPDAWKDFVEMAKHVGAPFITFSEVALEREEQARAFSFIDARSMIPHAQNRVARACAYLSFDRRLTVLLRVDDQVADQPPQQARIAAHGRRIA